MGNAWHYLYEYLGILSIIIISSIIALILLFVPFLLAPRNPDPEKLSIYECGFDPFSEPRTQFNIRYYLVAILFIIFDLEFGLLVPWVVSFHMRPWFGFVPVTFFLFILLMGFIYEWKKGALEWE